MLEELILERQREVGSNSKTAKRRPLQSLNKQSHTLQPTEQHKTLKEKKKIKRSVLRVNSSIDDVLNQISSRPSSRQAISSDDIAIKFLVLPYMDSFFKIEESCRIEEECNRMSKSLESSMERAKSELISKSPHTEVPDSQSYFDSKTQKVSGEYLKKRYSRLFSCFKFSEADLINVSHRSHLWMIHFMEECYDDALNACNKSGSREEKPKGNFNRLDLGKLIKALLNFCTTAVE